MSCPVGQDALFIFVLSCRPPGRREEAGQDKKCSSELSTGQTILSCRTGGIFGFCPVLPRRDRTKNLLLCSSLIDTPLGCGCHGHLSQTGRQLLTRVHLLVTYTIDDYFVGLPTKNIIVCFDYNSSDALTKVHRPGILIINSKEFRCGTERF